MTKIIITTPEVLRTLIQDSIREALPEQTAKPKDPEKEELLKISDVAKIFKVSQTTIHQWKKQGKIPFVKMGDRLYFKRSDINKKLRGEL